MSQLPSHLPPQGETGYDVAVIGAGPVGLYLAQRLGMLGHSVVLLERQPKPYGRPRAVHFDAEVGRLLAQAGIAEELRGLTQQCDTYDWRNAEHKTLLAFNWSGTGPTGWPSANMFCQPELEALLATKVEENPMVDLRRGEEAVDLVREGDGVTITAHGVNVKRDRVRARYVVGCDGANSFVRDRLGTTMTDLGFFFDWLVIDLVPHQDRVWSPVNIQICDPRRPTTAVSGGPGRRRFEIMRMPDESIEELETEAKVWELLAPWDYTPENADLERFTVYTFQARWADVWYRDRVAIAGDAAHLMPPFAGQGMCSGIRDAANLAWKLDLALKGLASDDLLETYTTERSIHVKAAIEESVALGNVICVTDPAIVAERDAFMLANGPDPANVLPPISPAKLGPGVLDVKGGPAVGTSSLQPVVRTAAGAEGLWDQAVGTGFALIGPLAAAEVLDAGRLAELERFGVSWARLVPSSVTPTGTDVVDVDDVVLPHLAEVGDVVAGVRPDGYLYGTVANPADVPSFVDGLLTQLAGSAPTEPMA